MAASQPETIRYLSDPEHGRGSLMDNQVPASQNLSPG